MKKIAKILIFCFYIGLHTPAVAQCSLCTKTALQMGEKPAKGLNQGILYLMFTPLIIIGIIGYRWWKNENKLNEQSQIKK